MTETSRVLVALPVPVPAARAFAAFSDQIAHWGQPNGLFRFSEGRSGVLALEPGPHRRLVETYPHGSSFVVGHIRGTYPAASRVSPPTWRGSPLPAERAHAGVTCGGPVGTRRSASPGSRRLRRTCR